MDKRATPPTDPTRATSRSGRAPDPEPGPIPLERALWRYDLKPYKQLVWNNRAELVMRVGALNVTGLISGYYFADPVFLYMLMAYNVAQAAFLVLLGTLSDRITWAMACALFGTVAFIISLVMTAAFYTWAIGGTEGKVMGVLLVAAAMLYSVSMRRHEPVASRIEFGVVSLFSLAIAAYTIATEDLSTAAVSYAIGLLAVVFYFILAAWSSLRAHERMVAAQAGEVQRARMEAIGQLAGGVAHDFNNLLTIIKGNLELRRAIQLQGGSLLEAEQLIREAEDATERAERTARHLLAFSRHNTLSPVRFRLSDALEETVPLLRASLPANIVLRTDLGRGLKTVRCDLPQLENVILNLVINARDAMPEGGQITLIVSETGAETTLDVIDTGMGIAPELIDKVTDPYFTTKPRGKGSGLGLSMARAFMDQSGGRLQVQSAPGMGTQVRLVLPTADPAPGPQPDLDALRRAAKM